MTTSDAANLELYRVSFENVAAQPEIAAILSEFGYGPDTMALGKAIFDETRLVYDKGKIEEDESSTAYQSFLAKKQQLFDIYALDRKKAKVIFRKDVDALERLAITGRLAQSYLGWVETVKKFYAVSLADSEIQAKLAMLKITPEHLTTTDALVRELETARSVYLRERGQSQNATKLKDAALDRLEDWMRDFYAVAKIVLEDRPQLAETLGKMVRS